MTPTKTHELELLLVERTNGKRRKVIRRETLGFFLSAKEAHEAVELVELPDMNHIIVI
jgi:hypothetical protein